VLYAAEDGLGCRVCLRLVYPSTREDDLDRYLRKAAKLRKRLGCPGGLGAPMVRPHGMDRRTFDRLVVELMRTEARARNELEARLVGMVDRLKSRRHVAKRGVDHGAA